MKLNYLPVGLGILGVLGFSSVAAQAAVIETQDLVSATYLVAEHSTSPEPTSSLVVATPSQPETSTPPEAPQTTPSETTSSSESQRIREVYDNIRKDVEARGTAAKEEALKRVEDRKALEQEAINRYAEAQAKREEAKRVAAEAARTASQEASANRTEISNDPSSLTTESNGSERDSQDSTTSQSQTIIAQVPTLPSDEPPQPPKADSKVVAKKLNLGQLLTFACGAEKGTPTTIAKLNKREFGVVQWNSTLFTAKGFDPKTRCSQVSARFEEYRKAHPTVYLTIGKLNGQSVVCVASTESGECGAGIQSNAGLLFTLKPNANGRETIEQLANVLDSERTSSTEPLNE